jgi:hypothetical protein
MNSDTGIWFPTETICKRRRHTTTLLWIRTQRKISKKTIFRDFYFTRVDLANIKRVTIKTKGQNPDKEINQCPPQNTPEFSEKTLDKAGVNNNTRTQTSNSTTDERNTVKTPLGQENLET